MLSEMKMANWKRFLVYWLCGNIWRLLWLGNETGMYNFLLSIEYKMESQQEGSTSDRTFCRYRGRSWQTHTRKLKNLNESRVVISLWTLEFADSTVCVYSVEIGS